MRTYEVAAVKMAVKRSVKAGDIQRGFNSIANWRNYWEKEGVTVDVESVTKCFKKWAKHKQAM